MKKKILSMVCAIILGVTCFAPLNVKAEFIKPVDIIIYTFDSDGKLNNSAVLKNGVVALGSFWSANGLKGFETYQVQFNVDIPTNYSIEIYMETKITGLVMSTEAEPNIEYFFADNSALSGTFDATEHWVGSESSSTVSSRIEYQNNSGQNLKRISFYYHNFAGNNAANYTILTIPFVYINIYDQYGRIVDSINEGNDVLHNDLTNLYNGINSWINTQTENIGTFCNNIIQTLYYNFDLLYNNVTSNFNLLKNFLSIEFDDLIDAIRGDDKEVNSKDDVDDTNSEMENTFDDYNNIENGIVQDFNSNIGAIRPNEDLLTNNDFINTSTFVATQMTNIYNSNDIVKMTITFGLIIGLAFTMIGISVRR